MTVLAHLKQITVVAIPMLTSKSNHFLIPVANFKNQLILTAKQPDV